MKDSSLDSFEMKNNSLDNFKMKDNSLDMIYLIVPTLLLTNNADWKRRFLTSHAIAMHELVDADQKLNKWDPFFIIMFLKWVIR